MPNVTKNALIKRINRHLRHDGEQLHALRGERGWQDLGDYYIVDHDTGFLQTPHVDVEALGRELGVLRQHEQMIDDA